MGARAGADADAIVGERLSGGLAANSVLIGGPVRMFVLANAPAREDFAMTVWGNFSRCRIR